MSTTVMTDAQKGENLKLEVRRVIRASRQRVFAAWTSGDAIRQWFGPPKIAVLDVEIDARVGGAYRIRTTPCSGESAPDGAQQSSTVTGEYRTVIPNELLSFTWRPEWSPGEESLVTVELRDVEGGTELILRHERFPNLESRDRHEQGWTGLMEKLSSYLGG